MKRSPTRRFKYMAGAATVALIAACGGSNSNGTGAGTTGAGTGTSSGSPVTCYECACDTSVQNGCADICGVAGDFCSGMPALEQCAACIQSTCGVPSTECGGGGTGGGSSTSCMMCACSETMAMGGCSDICDGTQNGVNNFCNGVPALSQCAACIASSCDVSDPSQCM